jgi:hypothetical protein
LFTSHFKGLTEKYKSFDKFEIQAVEIMKFIVLSSLLLSVALAQVLQPLDFDHTKLRNIWESPELQPALKNLSPQLADEVSRDGRILNGTRASPGQFPYHVLLVIDNAWWCGGSLIKSNWILTVTLMRIPIDLSTSLNVSRPPTVSIKDPKLLHIPSWISTSATTGLELHQN